MEGEWLRNAFRWKETVGPWEKRPGHFGDVWMYWTDDGLGYFEFLQVSVVFNFHGVRIFIFFSDVEKLKRGSCFSQYNFSLQ